MWLADTLRTQCEDVAGKVYSFDLKSPQFTYPGVVFKTGDSNKVKATWPDKWLASQPHPWLVIEDAHVNVANVLDHLVSHMRAGDYLVIEDCGMNLKRKIAQGFLLKCGTSCKIDTMYTDYFGTNMMSGPDAIIKIVSDQ